MRTLVHIGHIVVFIVLTLITQVGGIIYVLTLLARPLLAKRITAKWSLRSLLFGIFVILYCIVTFAIVPVIAQPFGRVSLPISETNHVKPLHFFSCLLNRHYVRPQLKAVMFAAGNQLNEQCPGSVINYLDAGFPFMNGFPLLPHLSHSDGKKVDVAFCYIDKATGVATNMAPSPIGYGINEEQLPGEENTTAYCKSCGFKRYDILTRLVPQYQGDNFKFDAVRTRHLVDIFASQQEVGKLFIEPHLKTRLKLISPKVRFQGCHAIRHDDHLHIQLR